MSTGKYLTVLGCVDLGVRVIPWDRGMGSRQQLLISCLGSPGNGTSQSADLRIRRQHSSDSVSSINSATSHSSVGSNIESDSKKKKRKNWVSVHPKTFMGTNKPVSGPSPCPSPGQLLTPEHRPLGVDPKKPVGMFLPNSVLCSAKHQDLRKYHHLVVFLFHETLCDILIFHVIYVSFHPPHNVSHKVPGARAKLLFRVSS